MTISSEKLSLKYSNRLEREELESQQQQNEQQEQNRSVEAEDRINRAEGQRFRQYVVDRYFRF